MQCNERARAGRLRLRARRMALMAKPLYREREAASGAKLRFGPRQRSELGLGCLRDQAGTQVFAQQT